MQGLIDADTVPQLMAVNHFGNVRHVPDSQNVAPAGALLENRQMLRPVDIRRRVIKIRSGRQLQHEAAPQLKQGKHPDRPGGGGHGTVKILPHSIHGIHGEIRQLPAFQQLHLVRLLLLREVIDGVLPGPLFFLEG